MINYSIIIPHKDIPDLLQRCLNSIPVRDDIEAIVVDDNSDPEKVDFEHFPQWKGNNYQYFLTKEGKGPGYARNVGLDHARGRWMVFADADDFFTEDFSTLLDEMVDAEADIVFFDYVNVLSDDITQQVEARTWYRNLLANYLDGKENSEALIRKDFMVPWCKLVKSDLIKHHHIRFSESQWSNDLYFSAQVGCLAETIAASSIVGYVVTQRHSSLTDNFCGTAKEYRVRLAETLKCDKVWEPTFGPYARSEYFLRHVCRVKGFGGCVRLGLANVFYPRIFWRTALFMTQQMQIINKMKKAVRSLMVKIPFVREIYRAILGRLNIADKNILKQTRKGISNLTPEQVAALTPDERRDYYVNRFVPEKVRLEVSTVCQLRCAGCSFQKGGKDNLGRGFLSVENFRKFCEMNPFVREIEISNWGEPFLNPNMIEIMHIAKEKGIKLTCWNGSNFNTISDEVIRALVDTEFGDISLSIDGATPETYEKYRIRGDFNRVMENVKRLQAYKKEKGSKFPKLHWQYVLMEHNELEVGKAKALAKELDIPISFKLNWDESYEPVNREFLMKETGLTELTRKEYLSVHKLPPLNFICSKLFSKPQINWDGRLLGCCDFTYANFETNVFEVGLIEALQAPKFLEAKECLLSLHPDKEQFKNCPCYTCKKRMQREAYGVYLFI